MNAIKVLEIFSAAVAGFRFLKEGMLECCPLDGPIAREEDKLEKHKEASKTGYIVFPY
jgi:hypothetical protein